jgi:phosphate transport system permease protein
MSTSRKNDGFSLLYFRRKLLNQLVLASAVAAMAFGLFWLGWILTTLISHSFASLSTTVFTQMTPPPGGQGGLLNAIYGSLLLTTIATAIGTPIGILAGTYLSEFGQGSPIASVVRFINSILLSAPSVVIGFFIYSMVVFRSGHFSGWAGAFALATILIPVVVNSTENMLKLVPNQLREAAAALGAPQWKVVMYVAYRAARAGMLTGILLAVARISGETAPLLFTSLNNQFWNTDMSKAMANLPVVIFQFAMSPYEDWQHLAWVGALLITLTVLVFNILARIFLRDRNTKN